MTSTLRSQDLCVIYWLETIFRKSHAIRLMKSPINFNYQCVFPVQVRTSCPVRKLDKWKRQFFAMQNLVSKLYGELENCNLYTHRYFKTPSWGCQNVSKETLLKLSKFHEKILSRSRDIQKFLSPLTDEGLLLFLYVTTVR